MTRPHWLAAGLALLSAADATEAQTAAGDLQTIVITGRSEGDPPKNAGTATKTDTPLRDIPQTINVVTGELLRERGVIKLNEALETVPGVQGGTGYGGLANGYGYYIRGFGSYTNYRDGFRDFSFISARDISLFERVEVLKGPASVLYGTNDPGGIVNFVSKRPSFDAHRELTLSYGSFDAKRASLDATGPLDESRTLAWRLVATADDRESHRDFVDSQTHAIAPSLSWRASPDTTVTLLTEAVRQDYVFERGFTAEPELIDLPRERFLEEPDLNRAKASTNRMMLDVQHRLDADWSLRGAFSMIRSTMNKLNFYPFGLDEDRRTFLRSLDDSDESTNDRALQVELTGRFATGGVRHTMLAGIEAFRSNFRYTFAPFDLISGIDIHEPVYGNVVIPPGFLDTVAFGSSYGSRTAALYLQDQLTFSDEWKATIGLRYDRARLFNDDLVDPSFSLRPQTQSRVSPRIGAVYQPSAACTFFAGYSTSFNPQIFYPLASGELPKPEIGEQVEIGWRQSWLGGSLDSTVSAFEIRKKNVTTTDPDNPQLNIQVGEQRSRGIEFELQGRIARGLTVHVAAAHIDAEVAKDNTLPVGDRLDSAPRDSGSVWMHWRPAAQGWFAGGGVFYVGEREATLPNNGVRLPAETRLDAVLGYAAQEWELQLNTNNLTDERIYVPYSGLFIPGPGRNAELAFTLRF